MGAVLSEPSTSKHSRPSGPAVCAHCAGPVDAALAVQGRDGVFCCRGCEFVHGLIHEQGLEYFYALRSEPQPPAGALVFQRRNFQWFVDLCAASQGRVVVGLQGISCLGCVWLVERVFRGLPGALEARVDPLRAVVEMRLGGAVFPALEFAQTLQRLGYLLGPVEEKRQAGGVSREEAVSTGFRVRMGVCAALAMNAMLFATPAYCGLDAADRYARVFEWGALVCAAASMAVGGSYFAGRAVGALRRGLVHVDLPIALGVLAAFAGSLFAWKSGDRRGLYFDFVSVFTFLMLLGRWVHQSALVRNRRRLLHETGQSCQPSLGEVYEVPSGAVVPVRSVLRSREADLGMEWINGEPGARAVFEGQIVPSGAVNLSAAGLRLESVEAWQDSLLAQLMRVRAESRESDVLTRRFISWYLGVVLAVGFGGFVAWRYFLGSSVPEALQVLVSVLVVSCPCASGVALPLASQVATARMREAGVFVRDAGLWRRLLRVRRIAFDKTGTLSAESLKLLERSSLEGLAQGALEVLHRLVGSSLHPVASALREALGRPAQGARNTDLDAPRELAGLGVEWRSPSGEIWRLGRAPWALEGGESGTDTGCTVFSKNGVQVAAFRFGEVLRPDAVWEVARLRDRGLEVVILSGDDAARVRGVGALLGVEDGQALGELSPAQKSEWLRERGAGEDTLMLGDGANDALAFAECLCSGTPAVDRGMLEHRADFFYLGRGLAGVRCLLEMADLKWRVSLGVVAFAGAYNLAAVGLALTGKMHPLLAAVLMPLSSLATLGLVLVGFRNPTRSKTVSASP